MSNTKKPGGCMGKILSVNLSNYGTNDAAIFKDIEIDNEHYEKLLTGYGLASKIIYDNQKPDLPPLHEDNVFAVMSGLLTGTGAFFSGRWMVAGKSPLTGLWGDANCGGYFAPAIKKTGYDGIFFIGKSSKPVYLYIDDDVKELRDAHEIWTMDSYDTQYHLLTKYGTNFKVACIGPGGENCSFLAGIVTDGGRLAARSGLGALMGSKKLKALCLGAGETVDVHDVETMSRLDVEFIRKMNTYKHLWRDKMLSKAANSSFLSGIIRCLSKTTFFQNLDDAEVERYVMRKYGTAGSLAYYANTGVSPIRNWTGIAPKNFPTKLANKISAESVVKYNEKMYGCHHCPLSCGAEVDVKKFNKDIPDDIFKLQEKKTGSYANGPHKPEYETLCGFGDMILNDSIYSIIKVNDICNRAGIDTISTAVTVSWAFEAYKRGALTKEDTDGLELLWGADKKSRARSAKTLVELVTKIAQAKKTTGGKKSIGEILMDGVERAAAYIDEIKPDLEVKAVDYALNSHKQELPMYDTRNKGNIPLAVTYEVEPTPGRHTSSMPGEPDMFRAKEKSRKQTLTLKRRFAHTHVVNHKPSQNEEAALSLKEGSCFEDIVNGSGLCNFAFGLVVDGDKDQLPFIQWLNAATGWGEKDVDYYLTIGHRIKTIRKLFNYTKCGAKDFKLPERATKFTPLKEDTGADIEEIKHLYYKNMGFDEKTGKPTDDIIKQLEINTLREIKLNF